jgi:hypothetical protein
VKVVDDLGAHPLCRRCAPGQTRDVLVGPVCDADPGRLGLLHSVFLLDVTIARAGGGQMPWPAAGRRGRRAR